MPPQMPSSLADRRVSRRTALSGAAAAVLGAPLFVPRRVLGAPGTPGANDQVGVGVIGVGFRATLLVEQLPEAARVVALCDCDLSRAEEFRKKKGADWPVYQDYRQLLERPDVDAVIVATQEFQRVLPCIHACQAGKDVYAEKPLSLGIHEGRVLVKAVRKYGRVLQVGTQQRSMEMNRVACDFLRGGGLGAIREVRAVNYTGPQPLPAQPFPEEPTPPGLDWDMWLNQAAWRPYNAEWRGGWQDMTGGEMTNWGAHGIDQVQWALGTDDTGPVEIKPVTPGFNGEVTMRYASGVVLNLALPKGPIGGAVFIGEKGKLEINRNKFASNPPEIAAELLRQVDVSEEERKWSDDLALWQARWHLQNWLDCVRTRETPRSDVEIGHRSVSVCHLANIARYLGRALRWDPAAERFEGDDEANRWAIRERRPAFALPDIA
jgi:predicted dehydrogenase